MGRKGITLRNLSWTVGCRPWKLGSYIGFQDPTNCTVLCQLPHTTPPGSDSRYYACSSSKQPYRSSGPAAAMTSSVMAAAAPMCGYYRSADLSQKPPMAVRSPPPSGTYARTGWGEHAASLAAPLRGGSIRPFDEVRRSLFISFELVLPSA